VERGEVLARNLILDSFKNGSGILLFGGPDVEVAFLFSFSGDFVHGIVVLSFSWSTCGGEGERRIGVSRRFILSVERFREGRLLFRFFFLFPSLLAFLFSFPKSAHR